MRTYEVECWVECRTVYAVEAEDEGAAREYLESNANDPGPELIVEIGAVERTGEVQEVA